jgi:transposase-like protein
MRSAQDLASAERVWEGAGCCRVGGPMPPCPACQQPATKRNGFDCRGRQKYACRACRRTFTADSISAFSGYRWPADAILTAVRWYLAYPLSSRQVLELLAERGIDVSHRTVLNWVQAFGPQLAAEVRRQRRPVGKRWFVDEVFLFRKGHKLYLYRAIDEDGVVDIVLREHRDTKSAAAFFRQAIERTGVIPHEVITDRHQPYVKAVATTCPGAVHIRTGLHRARGETTRAVERSHVPTRDRLRNSRGLKRTTTGQRFLEGYEAVRHLRRGGPPGAGHLVPGRAPHANVRRAVAAIHALGHGLRRR